MRIGEKGKRIFPYGDLEVAIIKKGEENLNEILE